MPTVQWDGNQTILRVKAPSKTTLATLRARIRRQGLRALGVCPYCGRKRRGRNAAYNERGMLRAYCRRCLNAALKRKRKAWRVAHRKTYIRLYRRKRRAQGLDCRIKKST